MLDSILLFGMPGGPEILIILAIVILLFGGRKIPELMKGIGKGINEFKKGTKEGLKEVEEEPSTKDKKE